VNGVKEVAFGTRTVVSSEDLGVVSAETGTLVFRSAGSQFLSALHVPTLLAGYSLVVRQIKLGRGFNINR
jgi:hypothetical protein